MIHFIGNSHVNTFSGSPALSYESCVPNFKLYHLGGIIAYNFNDNHLPKVEDILKKYVDKKNDYVSIVVGEVDCRVHLPLQADRQNNTDYIIVEECLNRLFLAIDKIHEQGYKQIMFSTHPTTTLPHDMSKKDRPIYSSMERRNNICLFWNNILCRKCHQRKIPFISFYDLLVDKDNVTKMEYYLDYCHLNSEMIIEKIIDRLLIARINNDHK